MRFAHRLKSGVPSTAVVSADSAAIAGPLEELKADLERRQMLARHRLTLAQLEDERLAIQERRDRRARHAAASLKSWTVMKERKAAEERKRNCRVCRNSRGVAVWDRADLEFHERGHPANWTWRPTDDAVAARLERLESAVALLVETVSTIEKRLMMPVGLRSVRSPKPVKPLAISHRAR